jgi:hypothetical protein
VQITRNSLHTSTGFVAWGEHVTDEQYGHAPSIKEGKN